MPVLPTITAEGWNDVGARLESRAEHVQLGLAAVRAQSTTGMRSPARPSGGTPTGVQESLKIDYSLGQSLKLVID